MIDNVAWNGEDERWFNFITSIFVNFVFVKFSIIIPTSNKCTESLQPCINSLIKNTDLSNTEVIIVANGCTDNTKEFIDNISKDNPAIKLLWIDDAIGYTKATNMGIRAAKGDYIILLNNDTEILDWGKNVWIDILKEPFLKYGDCGITGPYMNYDYNANRNFLIFFCVMIKKSIFDKIGLLDECFSPGYGEDLDYCLKVEDSGYKVIQVPEGQDLTFDGKQAVGNFPLYHEGSGTFGDYKNKEELIQRNNNILKQRYGKMEVNIEKALLIDGWMAESELRWLAEKSTQSKVFIEIGSFKGRSSYSIVKNLPEDGILYCIDTFLGSETERNFQHKDAKLKNGDFLYLEFLKNMWEFYVTGKVKPIRMSSENASNLLYENGIKSDCLFIDAAHEFLPVKNDIKNWLRVCKKNSIICGHDFYPDGNGWPGVYRAVKEAFPNVKHAPNTSIWYQEV